MRYRIGNYERLWNEQGIVLTVWAFMSRRFYIRRRNFGTAATLEKLFHFAVCSLRLLWRIAQVRRFDVVIIHREVFPLGPPWAERLIMSLNPNVVFDVDDAIWCPPSNEVNQRRWLWSESRFPRIIGGSREVVVGSPVLQQYAQRFNSQVTLIPTPAPDLGSVQAPKQAIPIIVWIGNLGNAEYLNMVMPALESLAGQFQFRLRLIGGEDIEEIKSPAVEIERLRWNQDDEAGWLREADIGIMPLYDSCYERGKCSFKLIQYFSASLPVVASPVGMNTSVVEEGINGFLAAGEDQWRVALSGLLEAPEQRKRLGEAGRSKYEHAYSPQVTGAQWLEILWRMCKDKRLSAREV